MIETTASRQRFAVLSMDIEDWYHLDYFAGTGCDRDYTMLDGLDRYRELLERRGVPSSYFVLGDLLGQLKGRLREIAAAGGDIGVHGRSHVRPLTLDVGAFRTEVDQCKRELEDTIGSRVLGYRAPCFSLDRARLDILRDLGYCIDSSRISFGDHPLYGDLDISGFEEISPWIYRLDDFFEFQVSTLGLFGRQVPISGGGYLRIFPWFLMRALVRRYARANDLYVLYAHPFEMSAREYPSLPAGVGIATRSRFTLGKGTSLKKLDQLVTLLADEGYEFTTFTNLRTRFMAAA